MILYYYRRVRGRRESRPRRRRSSYSVAAQLLHSPVIGTVRSSREARARGGGGQLDRKNEMLSIYITTVTGVLVCVCSDDYKRLRLTVVRRCIGAYCIGTPYTLYIISSTISFIRVLLLQILWCIIPAASHKVRHYNIIIVVHYRPFWGTCAPARGCASEGRSRDADNKRRYPSFML